MQWQDLKRLQDERRRLNELEAQLSCSGAMPGTRIHDVLQEHKRRLEARYRRALQKVAHGEGHLETGTKRRTW